MALLDTVEKLRKLEAEATPATWYLWNYSTEDETVIATDLRPTEKEYAERHRPRSDYEVLGSSEWIDIKEADVDLIIALRNAAPALLQVLGCFRPGDANRLSVLIEYMGLILEEGDFEDPTEEDALIELQIVVRRMQEACRLMEG